MDPHAVKTLIRQTVTFAPLVVPVVMAIVTQRAFARARKIKDLAINEVIPFSEFAAAELRARRLAVATLVLALIGTVGLASMVSPPVPVRTKAGAHEDFGDLRVTPVATSRDIVPSRPNAAPATTNDDKGE